MEMKFGSTLTLKIKTFGTGCENRDWCLRVGEDPNLRYVNGHPDVMQIIDSDWLLTTIDLASTAVEKIDPFACGWSGLVP
jgi:hypothetical protein